MYQMRKKILMRHFREVNIPTNKQVAFMKNTSGSASRVGCTERDVRNHERDSKEDRRGHDA